jgi:hypothetical protein
MSVIERWRFGKFLLTRSGIEEGAKSHFEAWTSEMGRPEID